jgi:hypothetical protein
MFDAADARGDATTLAVKTNATTAAFVANFKNPALPLTWATYY